MEIKILGPGCPNCRRVERVAREAAAEAGVEATITHVTQLAEIMAYPIIHTPGLVIDGQVMCSGRIPHKEEVIGWLNAAAA
jgi:small redox-active disulfide protein 2